MISICLLWLGILSEREALCPGQRLDTCEGQDLDIPSSFKHIVSTSQVIKSVSCFLFWVGIISLLSLEGCQRQEVQSGKPRAKGAAVDQGVYMSSATDLLLSELVSCHWLFPLEPQCLGTLAVLVSSPFQH